MSITRIFDIPYREKELFPGQMMLAGKENGQWKKWTTTEVISTARALSKGMINNGVVKGDKVSIISANRPEWNITDIALLQAGIINVPLYTTLSESEIIFILNDCKVTMVFAGDAALAGKIKSVQEKVPSLTKIYSYDTVSGIPNWTELVQAGEKSDDKKLDNISATIQKDDVATLLYTSGTTGTPKGVMLTHNNIVSNILASKRLCPVTPPQPALSFLPLCHSYERMLTYVYMYMGIPIYYAESMEKISDNLKEIKPYIFSTVPRLLEKVYDKILAKGKEQKGIKEKLFFWALNLGLRYEFESRNGWFFELQLKIANSLIFSKWREALGGNVKVIISGGAALQPRLARVFWAARIPVLEGYGLTETSPVIAVNNFEKNGIAFGTVGPVIENVQVKIADDGEILCKGPNVMKGYYNRPDLTADVIDADGWFHTGDIGTMIDNHFLKITDRKKEIFKTSGGKYIAPQAVENKFKESLFIEELMIIGENRKFAAALIVPSFAHLKKWCEEKNIPWTTNSEMIENPQIISRIKQEVESFNKDFGQVEQVKKFILLPVEWSTATGELTATLKLRRKIIYEKFSNEVSKIYYDNE
jgi:long-chain acyl-CoA synthetase